MSKSVLADEESGVGLSPSALIVYISADQLGVWRLRKSLALNDARWALKSGRKDIASQHVRGARFSHREILRIRHYLRTRETLPHQQVERAPIPPLHLRPELGDSPLAFLAPRERQFVSLLARGKSHQDIAAEFGIKVTSAYVYQCSIASKLGLKSRGLPRYAAQQGWG